MKKSMFICFWALFFILNILGNTKTVYGVILTVIGSLYIPMAAYSLSELSTEIIVRLSDNASVLRKTVSYLFVIVWNMFIGFIFGIELFLLTLIMYLTRKSRVKTIYFGVTLSAVLSVVNPYYLLMPISYVFIHFVSLNKTTSF